MRMLLTFLFLIQGFVYAQSPNLINVQERNPVSLNGEWHYIIDPYENGFYNYRYQAFDEQENPPRRAYFMDAEQQGKSDLLEYHWDAAATMQVPGDWNHQDPRLEYYEGSVWFRKKFNYNLNEGNRVFLHFGAVNYEAHVYLNGKKLGTHVGGFTPFQYEVTDLLKEENSLVLMVNNNRKAEGVPTLNTDWWNYGGITRDVLLVETPPTFIKDYFIQADPENGQSIRGYVQLEGTDTGSKIQVSIPELGLSADIQPDESGRAGLSVSSDDIEYWSPENPKRYEVRITYEGSTVTDHIGFRTITTDGGKILLNGEPVFLRGISIHEENPYRIGRANSPEDAELLLGWAKDMGCNYVRLAHYPHNEHMIEAANEMGLMVWEEIPVYWAIHWDNPDTYQNAEKQLATMIHRDKNSAATIIWSLANETPQSEVRHQFLFRLADKARSIDDTRLLSAAMEIHNEPEEPLVKIVEDKLAETVDLVSFNEYIGWYEGLPSRTQKVSFKIPYDKPVIISEFGAGTKEGFHADSLTRWSEEYQASTYRLSLKMIDQIPNIAGISPWILVDFRSPRRPLAGIQDGWNRKGLISNEGKKKQAYYILQDYYQEKEAEW